MAETLESGSVGSDAELITRVRAGDRTAYGELYARHSAAASTLARQFSRSPAEADDLVSESFARVLDTLLAGGGPDSAFRAYLFTTLRNTAYDRSRKDKRLQFTDDVEAHDVAVDTGDPVLLQAENTLVGKAFAALPERWQAVLWYTQVDGMSPAETGVLLGMSANAVTSLAYRAREGLREAYLQAHLADTAAERCRTTVDRLGAWARGGLSKREQAQVDAHLAQCDRCQALAAELTEINSGIRGLIAPLLLGGAAAGYLAATSTSPLVLASAGTLFAAHTAGATAGATTAGIGTAAGSTAAGSTGAGAVAGSAGATAGGHAAGAAAGFWTRPWVLAGGGAVAAAVIAAVAIVAVSLGGSPTTPAADHPPAVTSIVTGPTSPGGGASGPPGPADSATGTADPVGPADTVATGPATSGPTAGTSPTGTAAATTTPSTTATGTSDDGQVANRSSAAPPITVITSGAAATNTTAPSTPPATPTTTPQGPTSPSQSPSAPPSTAPSAPTSTTPSTVPTTSTTPSTAPTTPTTSTSPTATPAALSAPRFTTDSVEASAGGTATVSFTVQNSGGTASDPQTLQVSTPTGVALAGGSGTVGPQGSPLRRVSALLAFAAAPADDPVACAKTACRYTVPANSTLTVTLRLSIDPAAVDGPITLSADGSDPVSMPITVGPGLIGLQMSTPPGGWAAGRTVTTDLTGTVADGVTSLGTITLPVRNGDVWITGYPAACAAVAGDATTISCSGAAVAGTSVDLGEFQVSLLPGAAGAVTIDATRPGAHPPLPVMGADPDDPQGAPITIAPLAPGAPITLTGPFGGTLIGAETMSCAVPATTRGDCPGGLSTVSVPQSLTIPASATVVSAILTWAATAPAGGADPAALDTVTFHAGPQSAVPVVGTRPFADQQDQMYVRTADVTADLTGTGSYWADGIDATATTAGTTAMAGWSLAVIWYDPAAQAAVNYVNPGTSNVSGPCGPAPDPCGTATELATAGAPIRSLSVVIWAADPWAVKTITADGSPLDLPATIDGVRIADDGPHATGFTLLDGIAAGATGDISLVNVSGPTQAPFHGSSNLDGLWVGPTLVIR